MNANTTRTLTAAIIAIALASGGCQSFVPIPAHRSAGDLAVDFEAGQAEGPVDVIVTGSDLSHAVAARLEARGGHVHGTVYDIAEGTGRRLLVTARTADGRLCARTMEINVEGRTVTPIAGESLRCEAAHTASPTTVAATDFPPLL